VSAIFIPFKYIIIILGFYLKNTLITKIKGCTIVNKLSHFKSFVICYLLFGISALSSQEIYDKSNQDYCSGYLSEVYGTLDPIEDPLIRSNIEDFFAQSFDNTDHLNYDLHYDINKRIFITNSKNLDLTDYKIVNYPNFEIIILNAHIKNVIFNNPHGNYCPAFGENCKSNSIDLYFKAAEDFSKSWNNYTHPIDYLNYDFKYNQCYDLLNTNISKNNFISDLNLYIQILLDQ
tara:strand:- start:650 stop:1348 length:699 start_codon:yes stop_codon:yes gene_type:complete